MILSILSQFFLSIIRFGINGIILQLLILEYGEVNVIFFFDPLAKRFSIRALIRSENEMENKNKQRNN